MALVQARARLLRQETDLTAPHEGIDISAPPDVTRKGVTCGHDVASPSFPVDPELFAKLPMGPLEQESELLAPRLGSLSHRTPPPEQHFSVRGNSTDKDLS